VKVFKSAVGIISGLPKSGLCLLRSWGSRWTQFAGLGYKCVRLIRREGLPGLWRRAGFYRKLPQSDRYRRWLEKNRFTEGERPAALRQLGELSYQPKISVLVPVYNGQVQWLRRCLDSVLSQLYPHWELCIADDASDSPQIKPVLEEYRSADSRVKVVYRDTNGHISAASNSALALATGEYIALLDHDDELTADALFENVRLLNDHPDADMIYSDEDKITAAGRRHLPLFKPDWSYDTFLAQMYTCHLGVYRTDLVKEIGGFREGFEGSQDYDLVLRLAEKTNRIYHIPKVLYSWRETAASTACNQSSKPYAHESGLRALNDHLSRKYQPGEAWCESTKWSFVYDVRYRLPENLTVSVIIPTRDKAGLLKKCVESIVQTTEYDRYEIVIMDNGSGERETAEYFKTVRGDRIKISGAPYAFNWARINNQGMDVASGEIFIFLNNDTLVISADWLTRLAEKAAREEIGTVGALLLYKNGAVQHAGVVVGMGGWADHVYKGKRPIHYGSPYISPLITRNVLASTGACLAVSRKTIERIGRFNEDFVVCGSDVELCIRAYQHGLRNVYDPLVKLYHLESVSRANMQIPEGDFRQSAHFYHDYLTSGDPFYNINLDLHSLAPAVLAEGRRKRSLS
jgi:GT2 family glycosyltransferase